MFQPNQKIVIWGMGREGRAAAQFIHDRGYQGDIIGVDEGKGTETLDDLKVPHRIIRDITQIEQILLSADVIIKSPGVSLYHKWLDAARQKNIIITSLFNLWFSTNQTHVKTLCVTGTKGKSTTASLLTHCLNALGRKAVTIGNIGVPVTEVSLDGVAYAVIEVSSYQAADFTGAPDLALVTSLFPEHLDWHGSLQTYYRDKLNLLTKAVHRIMDHNACVAAQKQDLSLPELVQFNDDRGFHVRNHTIYCGKEMIGRVPNPYLARAHNASNVCGVLAALNCLGYDVRVALQVMHDFVGLPHRQFELGVKEGVLYVDDSISTTPQSAIAAMDVYSGRDITLIAGGFDRGIDYAPLVSYIFKHKINRVICMGPSGLRIFAALEQMGKQGLYQAHNMQEVIALAKRYTPSGGVVLLSPAAPSYGLFKDFIARGKAFAAESGF